MDLKERECEGMDWIKLVQKGVQQSGFVNMMINLLIP